MKFEEAIKYFNRAIEINPNLYHTWYEKGNSLGILGEIDEAIECYDKAIELKPEFHEAWFNKAILYADKKNKMKMLNCLSKAIELNDIYKEKAKNNEAFKEFHSDIMFLVLTN